ncbi:MAG: hypothetical protein SXV54_13935 [Chloroflexota bacterium]|nr:hypothetical protein [Chloroflexota bacterium]
MPKRNRIRRFSSDEVQGKDSWVEVAQLTVGEIRESREMGMREDFNPFDWGIQLLSTHVMGWNWVNDAGEPLPQVRDNPDVIEQLSDTEAGFLSTCIKGDQEQVKN